MHILGPVITDAPALKKKVKNSYNFSGRLSAVDISKSFLKTIAGHRHREN